MSEEFDGPSIVGVEEVKPPVAVPTIVNEDTTLMALIGRSASDPTMDVAKLERLMDLYERIGARRAEQQFNEAMQLAQRDIQPVFRNAGNETTRSRYATLEAVLAMVGPVIYKHGLSMSFGTDQSPLEGHYRVTCTLSHIGGHSREYHADVPSDGVGMKGTQNKTPTHAFGSTMAYGRRYLILLIFNVATTDDNDGNSASSMKTISEAQRDALHILADDVKADKRKFCEFFGIGSFSELPVHQYTRAIQMLQAKARGKAEAGHA